MKGAIESLTFWKVLGIVIILVTIGNIIFRLAYGNKLIEATGAKPVPSV